MTSITLGDFETKREAVKDKVHAKKRLIEVIRYNKLKVKSSSFRFKITKRASPKWLNEPLKYPYNLSVSVPSSKYNWIFLH